MVAAPETQQQQQQEAPAMGHAQGQGLKSSFSKENVGKELENEEKGSVNGLAVVDGSDQSSSGATHNLPPPDVARHIPCRFFPLGTCKYGEQCIFSHGIPGIAGSPGVPPSPSVQPQVAPGQNETSQSSQQVQPQFVQNSVQQHQFQPQQHQHHQHQQMMEHQQVVPSMEQAYMQGMPMYYPEQALQYGFQPPFSPEQAYYHFAPPPFQAYPQHYQQFAPHAYYPPPPPASSVPHLSAAAQALNVVPILPTEVSPAAPSPIASPSQPTQNASPSPLETATSQVPHVVQQHTFPVTPQEISQGYPSNGGAESEEQTIDPSSSPSQGTGREESPLSRAPASLHTFFQTSSPMPPSGSSTMTTAPLPAQAGSSPNPLPPAAISNSPNGFVKPLPARLAGPRRSIGGVPTGPYSQAPGGMNGGKRRSFGGTRPPCSFFEANRCKNGDECSFVHLLQDGTDARALGRGMIGSDGRTDSPEATGGMPPAWLMNQKALRFAGAGANGAGANGGNLVGGAVGGKKHLEGGAIMNGGYSYRERGNGPVPSNGHAGRGRYEEDQQARYATRQQFQPPQVQMIEGQAQNHFSQALPQQQQHQQQPQNGYHRGPFNNGSLAGRIPPGGTPQLVAAINGLTRRIPPAQTSQAGVSTPQDASEGESVIETPSTVAQGSTPASREPSQQRIPTVNDFPALGSPAAPLSPNVEKESYTSAVESTVAAKKEEEEPKKEVASSPTEENDGFVMVSHQDASPSSPSVPPTASSTSPTATEPPKSPSAEIPPVPASSAPPPQTSTAPPTRPAQPPKLMVSFASIAKAASGPSVEKSKPKPTSSAPVQQANKSADQPKLSRESIKAEKKGTRLEDDAKNDDGFVTKTSKKSKKSAGRTPSTQVPIKA